VTDITHINDYFLILTKKKTMTSDVYNSNATGEMQVNHSKNSKFEKLSRTVCALDKRLIQGRETVTHNRETKSHEISKPSLGNRKGNNSRSKRMKPRTTKGEKKNKISTKHDMPMGKRDLYFALDCEMVGIGPYGAQSALARVSIVNWDCELVLDTFVKVPVPVTDYRTFVSGIRSEDIESGKAMDLHAVRIAVQNIIRGKILIGHALENDLKALNLKHPWCDIRDTATYAPYMREQVDSNNRRAMFPRRLKDLAWNELGKKIQVLGDAHSSIEDGIAALELYKAVRPQWEAFMSAQVKTANEIETSRIQKIAGFGRRRVQPMPMYQHAVSKQFDPLLISSNHAKQPSPWFFIPVQDPRCFSAYSPYVPQYSTPLNNQ